MYTLTEEQFQMEATPALRRIFVNDDPYDKPFAPNVEVRRFLYPMHLSDLINFKNTHPDVVFVSSGPDPETSLLDVIVSAAKSVDDGFYFSIVPWPGLQEQEDLYDLHLYFGFSELEEFKSMEYPTALLISLEFVIFSPSGSWGLIISEDSDYGLLGCTQSFFLDMQKVFPDCGDEKQVRRFLSDWKYYATKRGADVNWIPPLLAHVYDADTARQLLEEASFTDLL